MRLALGTAQFGLNYGISNQTGRVGASEAGDILAEAAMRGITLLDTAPAYGRSESILAELTADRGNFNIVSKTLVTGGSKVDAAARDRLKRSLDQTLRFFGGRPLYGMLVHHGMDTLKAGGEKILQLLADYRSAGWIERIGISVDRVEELDDLLGHFDFDIVQAPLSIFNQKLITGGYVDRLQTRNVEIHARSLFLQGLVFMDPENLPNSLGAAAEPLRRLRKLSADSGIDICTLSLSYVTNHTAIDYGIVGVTTRAELTEIDRAWRRARTDPQILALDLSQMAVTDAIVTTPSRWNEMA